MAATWHGDPAASGEAVRAPSRSGVLCAAEGAPRADEHSGPCGGRLPGCWGRGGRAGHSGPCGG
eukprot:1903677-Pyramimonas_sp.AAC.1